MSMTIYLWHSDRGVLAELKNVHFKVIFMSSKSTVSRKNSERVHLHSHEWKESHFPEPFKIIDIIMF